MNPQSLLILISLLGLLQTSTQCPFAKDGKIDIESLFAPSDQSHRHLQAEEAVSELQQQVHKPKGVSEPQQVLEPNAVSEPQQVLEPRAVSEPQLSEFQQVLETNAIAISAANPAPMSKPPTKSSTKKPTVSSTPTGSPATITTARNGGGGGGKNPGQGQGGGGGNNPGKGPGGGGGNNPGPNPSPKPVPGPNTASAKPTLATVVAPSSAPVPISPISPIIGKSTHCLKTGGAPLVATAVNTCSAYKAVKASFLAAVPSDAFGQANLFGQAVRIVFHDAAEADITKPDLARSDGCLSSDPGNAGLVEATSLINTVFEPIWQANCDQISRADFWVMIAQLAIETADPTKTIAFPYQYGRVDAVTCSAGNGRLPSNQAGQTGISQVFVTQLGLTMNDAVTLIGSHTVGHVHIANSGYGKPGVPASDNNLNAWDTTPNVFDNQYFRSVLNVPWRNTAQTNDAAKTLWVRNNNNNNNILLNGDITLGFDASTANNIGVRGQTCGGNNNNGRCNNPASAVVPSTSTLMNTFANSNAAFLAAYPASLTKLTTAKYPTGSLTSINLNTC